MCMTTPSVSGITCVVQWRDSAADEIPKVFGPNVDQSKATARVFFFCSFGCQRLKARHCRMRFIFCSCNNLFSKAYLRVR